MKLECLMHIACEVQMHFWSSLFFGGREATTGNTSALCRLYA